MNGSIAHPNINDAKMGLKKPALSKAYVFFSRQGGLFALLLVVTFVTGVNYGNNLILGFLFYLFGIWLISVFMTYSHLAALSVKLNPVMPVQAGECAKIDIQINNKGGTARQITAGFATKALGVSPPKRTVFGIPLNKQLTKAQAGHQKPEQTANHQVLPCATISAIDDTAMTSLYLTTHRRGVFDIPRLTISTVYPLGIMQAWRYAVFTKKIAVYPAPLAFDRPMYVQVGEQMATAHIKGQDEFLGLDTYKEGESLARVSWRHLASGQGMLLKQFTDPIGQVWAVDYFAMPSELPEDKLANLAYLLCLLKKETVSFEFVLPSGRWQGSGEQFVNDCLVKLAYEPVFDNRSSTKTTTGRKINDSE